MRVLKENAKAAVAFFTSLGGWAATAFSDDRVTAGETVAGIAMIGAATFGVWIVQNAPTADQLQALSTAIERGPEG